MFAPHPHNYRPWFERLGTITSLLRKSFVLSCPMLPPSSILLGITLLNSNLHCLFIKSKLLGLHKTCTHLIFALFFQHFSSSALLYASLWTTCLCLTAPCSSMLQSMNSWVPPTWVLGKEWAVFLHSLILFLLRRMPYPNLSPWKTSRFQVLVHIPIILALLVKTNQVIFCALNQLYYRRTASVSMRP